MNYTILRNELADDPLGRGYSGMTDLEAANDLNSQYRTRTLDNLDGGTVYDQVDVAEFTALTAEDKEEVWAIVHLGANIPVYSGSKARDRFISIFGGGSTTISNLQAIITVSISRSQELGLGTVSEGDVYKARSPETPVLLFPVNGAIGVGTTPTLSWSSSDPSVTGFMLNLDGTPQDVGNVQEYTTGVLEVGAHTWAVAAYSLTGTSKYTVARTFTV